MKNKTASKPKVELSTKTPIRFDSFLKVRFAQTPYEASLILRLLASRIGIYVTVGHGIGEWESYLDSRRISSCWFELPLKQWTWFIQPERFHTDFGRRLFIANVAEEHTILRFPKNCPDDKVAKLLAAAGVNAEAVA